MEIVIPAEFAHLYVTDEDHPVVKIPAPVLRDVSDPIERISKRHVKLAENMVRIMKEANGVGIAAPQVGVKERIVVIAPERKPIVLVNPKIVERSGTQVGEEGCLSIPGLYGDVERSEMVVVEAYDIKGRAFTYELEGYGATIVQHEVDHLDGVLFIDKVDPKTLHWTDPTKDR
jgi:peptide deformylase